LLTFNLSCINLGKKVSRCTNSSDLFQVYRSRHIDNGRCDLWCMLCGWLLCKGTGGWYNDSLWSQLSG